MLKLLWIDSQKNLLTEKIKGIDWIWSKKPYLIEKWVNNRKSEYEWLKESL